MDQEFKRLEKILSGPEFYTWVATQLTMSVEIDVRQSVTIFQIYQVNQMSQEPQVSSISPLTRISYVSQIPHVP